MDTKKISCYCLKTRMATGNLVKFYDNMLEPSGVTTRQYSLLLNISRREDVSVRELADMTNLERSTLARNLKPLFSRLLIEDKKLPGTRDSKLRLTKNGREVLEKAQGLWEKAQSGLAEKLGQEKMDMLETVLDALEAL